jgi:hypothetical protein
MTYFAARWLGSALLAGIAVTAIASIGYVNLSHTAAEYSLRSYPLLIAAFFGLVIATQASQLIVSSRIGKIIRFFAEYSFSL